MCEDAPRFAAASPPLRRETRLELDSALLAYETCWDPGELAERRIEGLEAPSWLQIWLHPVTDSGEASALEDSERSLTCLCAMSPRAMSALWR
mmetsp:Transcript_83362/g.217720  ORF Transcript_83362/g.217720 Transcript_83362/m.217720 type:complete len:93 (+) Transcript_83362:320-598(+)